MPPKKEAGDGLLKEFEDRETKLIAAAFLSTTGPDKFDYDLMAALTGNTVGSLKKMWPPVKRKAMEKYTGFAKFLGQPSTSTAAAASSPAPKIAASKKRKAASEDETPDNNASGGRTDSTAAIDKSDGNKSNSKKKTPVAKKPAGRPRKQIKMEEEEEEGGGGEGAKDDAMDELDVHSAGGSDGLHNQATVDEEEI
ncbi:hypothetical protein IAQ61_005249 [Plenodomus lingam]|uniref:uncharacterized protein n=1 Tax=Leptosphaeria maculans TaxID=5022 RepID=UPI003328885E|nr:hypothetical protein IAQ61_005249 [Plenodomus lingam]